MGKPQGIPFFIECLREQRYNPDVFFLIVGEGTEYLKLYDFIKMEKPGNVLLLERMPKDEYDRMVAACDIGLIFLDYRFTIPNFPSRLLSYMQAKLPVWAITDSNTDIGSVIKKGDFGWWCESKNVKEFSQTLSKILAEENYLEKGRNSWNYLLDNYSVSDAYNSIMSVITQKQIV